MINDKKEVGKKEQWNDDIDDVDDNFNDIGKTTYLIVVPRGTNGIFNNLN